MLKFSIIVPVYNSELYLEKCVNSILKQSYQNIELILINDGSTDGSSRLCDEIAEKDSRVVVIHKLNGGVSDARNVGIKKATGEYILFVDSDDFIEINACEMFYKSIKANPSLEIIATNIKVINDKQMKENCFLPTKNVISTGEEFLSTQLDKWMAMFVWRFVYKRALLIENQVYFDVKLRYYEEETWLPKVLLLASKVATVDFIYYNYIIRNNSLSNPLDENQIVQSALDHLNVLYDCINQYSDIKNTELRKKVLDRLVISATNAIKRGKLYRSEYNQVIDNDILWKNAFTFKTKKKVLKVFLKSLLKR